MSNPTSRSAWQQLRGEPSARFAGSFLLLLAIATLLAPWITPYDPQLLLDPVMLSSHRATWTHPFGTDPYSRDVLSRMLAGARVSLTFAIVAVTLSTGIGTLVGFCSGFIGGMSDRLLMRLADVGLSIPRVLLLLTIVGLWGSPRPFVLALILAATGWMGLSRLVRGELRALRNNERILALRALGLRDRDIVWRHLLPDVLPFVIVSATMGIGQVILLESGLSYLGIGIQPPTASWGTILLDVSDVVGPSRWLALGPGLVIVGTVIAIQRIGDGLQTALAAREQS